MSIATALDNARTKIAACYTAINNKGGTLPATQNLANMADAINSISGEIGGISRYVVDEYGNATPKTGSLNFSDIVTIDENALKYAFYYSGISGALFPSLTSVDNHGLDSAFYNCRQLTNVAFPLLESVGGYACEKCFYGCERLTSISFPELTNIESHGFDNAFSGCEGLTSVSFPKLRRIDSVGLYQCFQYCTGLTTMSFPELRNLGNYGLTNAFNYCSNLTELHFRLDSQSVIEAQSGYDTNFGAENATIYFDL